MKKFIKSIISIFLIFTMVLGLASCSQSNEKNATKEETTQKEEPSSYEEILKTAKGTTVNFYGYGGDESYNKWVDNVLAKEVKEKYNVTLKRVPMDIDDVLNKLLGEKQGNADGTIDLVWINGENFYKAKKADLLYGPFVDKLPNFEKYTDTKSSDVTTDFGYPIEGYESPYGKAQFVMIYNKDMVKELPKNTDELLKLCKDNPGKFTYPAPPDFTGSVFVRNVIYDILGPNIFDNLPDDKEKVKEAIKPALDYLVSLKPYLWNEGKTYPSTLAQVDNMFADKQVLSSMSYNPNAIDARKALGEYPENATSNIFEKGTIGNTHFVGIPFNSKNKNGAMVVANEILTPKIQSSKYEPSVWGDLPVLEIDKMKDDEKKLFDNIKISESTVPMDTLLENRYPEPSASLVPIIEQIWEEYVVQGQ